jgi:hypothetical protein
MGNKFDKYAGYQPVAKEPVVLVRSKSLTFYTKFYDEWKRRPRLQNLIQFQNKLAGNYEDWLLYNKCPTDEKQRPYNGWVSPATKRKVSKYLEVWVEAVRQSKNGVLRKYSQVLPYFTFVTLTLSSEQKHDDKFIKRNLLGRWIEKSQRAGLFKYFFWRAEPQKNGNIHFHLLVDKYIPYEVLRETWNAIQAQFGYIEQYRSKNIEKYREGFVFDNTKKVFDRKTNTYRVVSYQDQKRLYNFGVQTNWTQPNSTDIKKISSIKDLTSYLLKYFTKNGKQETRGNFTCIESRTIDGRIIGKSKGLEKLESFCISELDHHFVDWLNHAERARLVEKEIDIVGNNSIVVVLGRFADSIKRHAGLSRKLLWHHLKILKQLYLPDINLAQIMPNPY